MKISKISKPIYKRPQVWVVGLIVLAGIAAASIYAYHLSHQSSIKKPNGQTQTDTNPKIDYNPPTNAQKQAGQDTKKTNIDNQSNSQPTNKSGSIVISRASQQTNNGTQVGQPISVRSIVTGMTSGQCVFSFTKTGQATLTKTVDIIAGATSYSCSVDVPAGNFSADGNWLLNAYITYNGSTVSNTVNWAGNPISVQR